MKSDKIAEKAMKRITATVGTDLSKAQADEVRRILSDLVVEVVSDTAKHCSKRATELYGPHTDLASELADEIKRSKVALIANLKSMR